MKIYLNENYEIKKIDDINFGKGNNLYNFIEVWLFKSSVDKDNTLPSFSFKMGDFVFGQFIHNETRNDGDYLIFNFKIPDYILFEQGKLIITVSINFFNSNGIIVKNKNITVQGNVLDAVILNGDMIALSNDTDQLVGSIRKNIDQLNKLYDSTASASSVYTKIEVNSLLSEKVNRNEMKDDFDKLILENQYPVGSNYIQFPNAPTPAERWAGTTWEIDTNYSSRVFIGSGNGKSLGDTGGEEKHKLTIQELPSHYHYPRFTYSGSSNKGEKGPGSVLDAHSAWDTYVDNEAETTLTGGNKPFNLMPPYIVVNVWKRLS